jgi:hypothetical protein
LLPTNKSLGQAICTELRKIRPQLTSRDSIACHGLPQTISNQKAFSWVSLFVCSNITRGVSHCGLSIYIKKYLKEKKELWKLKYFIMQKIIFKKSSKRNQNPSRYYNSITNLKFQHKPKFHLSKILI